MRYTTQVPLGATVLNDLELHTTGTRIRQAWGKWWEWDCAHNLYSKINYDFSNEYLYLYKAIWPILLSGIICIWLSGNFCTIRNYPYPAIRKFYKSCFPNIYTINILHVCSSRLLVIPYDLQQHRWVTMTCLINWCVMMPVCLEALCDDDPVSFDPAEVCTIIKCPGN